MTNASQSPGISFGPGAGGTGGAIGAPTPAPIHDIVGPLPFFSGPLGIIVLVFLLVAVAGGLLWWFLGRKKAKVITPRQAALNALACCEAPSRKGTTMILALVSPM